MAKDVIIALDFENKEKTLAFLDQFTGRKPFVKIGMELFYAEGPDIVREIKARGHKIFLDLKLHDIPNTVKKAMKVLSKLDVDMTNLHAAGTIAMMQAAKEGLTKRRRHLRRAAGGDAADLDERRADAAGAAHQRDDAGDGEEVRAERESGGAERRSLLAAGSRLGEGSLRSGFPDGDAGHSLCRRRRGGSGARDDPGKGAAGRQRLHCGWAADYGGGGSGGGI